MIMYEQLHAMIPMLDYMTMRNIMMSVIMIVVVLIGSGVTFRHMQWIGCHVPTHILNRVSFSNTYIRSGVTLRRILWIVHHVLTH